MSKRGLNYLPLRVSTRQDAGKFISAWPEERQRLISAVRDSSAPRLPRRSAPVGKHQAPLAFGSRREQQDPPRRSAARQGCPGPSFGYICAAQDAGRGRAFIRRLRLRQLCGAVECRCGDWITSPSPVRRFAASDPRWNMASASGVFCAWWGATEPRQKAQRARAAR